MTPDAPSPLFHAIHVYVCCQSIACNLLLMFIIRNYTPIHLRSYSVMLLFTSTYELASATSGVLLFSRVISLGHEALIAVIYGPCSLLDDVIIHDAAICYTIYGLHLNSLTYYNLQMTASFGFRYYVLRFPVPTVKSTRRFNLLLALPTTICFVLFSFGRSPKSDIEDLLLKYVPQYDFSTTVIEALLNPTRNPCVLTTVWVCSTSIPCTCLNIFSGISIHRYLAHESLSMSKRTRASHMQFLKALLCQFLISQLFVLAVISFALGYFDVVKTPSLEYASHFIGEICVALSPLTTLYFVKPYREKVVDLVMRRQRKLTTLSSTDFSSTDTGATRRQSVKAIKISIHSNHLPNQ